jgi:hypothetical protein
MLRQTVRGKCFNYFGGNRSPDLASASGFAVNAFVDPGAAVEAIIPRPTIELVIARSRANYVFARTAIQHVVAGLIL